MWLEEEFTLPFDQIEWATTEVQKNLPSYGRGAHVLTIRVFGQKTRQNTTDTKAPQFNRTVQLSSK